MPKKTLIIEFEEDDCEKLKEYALLNELVVANREALFTIRSAIKHGVYEQNTYALLEKIREDLYVAGLD